MIGVTDEQRAGLDALRAMSPGIERAQAVKALAKVCDVPAAAVEAELAPPAGNGKVVQGAVLAFGDPEPWPAPVDGADLLAELAATFRRFLALPTHADTTLALWTMFAHAHDATDVSAVLSLTSPAHRCGKTSALELLGALTPRPLPAANVTAAALFRAVEKYLPTLLIDEADSFLKNSDELRGILNSGHSRRSAVVVRTVGDDHEPRAFATWSPKAIAMIGKLPATLADRSIEIPMRRRTRAEKVDRLRLDRLVALEPLRRRAWTWAQLHLDVLRAADPDVPDALHDRAANNWRPLLAIADMSGGEWPARARAAALVLSGGLDDEAEPVGALLLADLRDLFATLVAEHLASGAIVEHLLTLEHRPWPEWRNGRPMTVRQLARVLRPFGVQPKLLWIDGGAVRGYRREDFNEALSRYTPPSEPLGPLGCSPGAEKSGFSNCKEASPLTDAKTGEKPSGARVLTDLTDGQGGLWGGRVE